MKKVLAINSSNRKMNTYKVINQAFQILKNNEIEVELLNLSDYKIGNCIGCEHCLIKGNCVLQDQAIEVMEKIKSSDGIILTSPVYMENISGNLKNFIDRTCCWFHRPEIYGKPFFLIATTKGSGLKKTLSYLERVVIQWGGFTTGKIGKTITTIDNEVKEEELHNFIKHLNMDKKDFRPSLSELINFQVQKILSIKVGGLDNEYWTNKGWYHEIYYFKCKINFFKKLTAKSFYKFLNKVINK